MAFHRSIGARLDISTVTIKRQQLLIVLSLRFSTVLIYQIGERAPLKMAAYTYTSFWLWLVWETCWWMLCSLSRTNKRQSGVTGPRFRTVTLVLLTPDATATAALCNNPPVASKLTHNPRRFQSIIYIRSFFFGFLQLTTSQLRVATSVILSAVNPVGENTIDWVVTSNIPKI